jgi:imidazolonepropionase-like amidohydrolase
VEGIRAALDAGVDILTHCDITPERTIPDDLVKEIAAKGVTCSVMPTTKAYIETVPKAVRPFHVNSMQNIKALIAAGVPLMLSTDAGIENPLPDKPLETPIIDPRTKLGEGEFAALQGLGELGVNPMTILQIATINVAKGYKLDKAIGSLEPGKTADLLVLDKDPLADAKNYRSISMVIKDGRIVDRAALPSAPLISTLKALAPE